MNPKEMLNTGYRKPTKSITSPVLESLQTPTTFPTAFTTSCLPFKVPSQIFMQYQQPDCVENSVTWAKKFLDWRLGNPIPSLSRRSLVIPTVIADGVPYSNGTNVEIAIAQAGIVGIAETKYLADDHTLPLDIFSSPPVPPDAALNATTHKISGNFAMLSDLSVNGLKNAIFQNGFVIIAMDVNARMWTNAEGAITWNWEQILPLSLPSAEFPVVSGHCVVIYAYDEQYFYFFNWWSSEWGYNGRGWFGYDYVSQISEAAVVSDFTTPVPPSPLPEIPSKESLLQEIEQFVEKVI